MIGFLGRRLLAGIIVLFIASVFVFAGLRALPGDPAITLAGMSSGDPAYVEYVRERFGLNEGILTQYRLWLVNAMQGDLGRSVRSEIEVSTLIAQRIPVTLELGLLSIFIAAVIGIPAGVVAALRRNRPADYIANAASLLGLSIPNFWLAMMMILVFAVQLSILPASGYVPIRADPIAGLRSLLMPAIVLGTSLAAVLMRQTRSSVLDTLDLDYVRTARAKGIHERRVITHHVLRNSLVTVVTIVGLQLGFLISGAIITETIFAIPGFGRLIVDAVFTRDYAVVQGVVLVSAMAYVIANFGVDVVYALLNPRLRRG